MARKVRGSLTELMEFIFRKQVTTRGEIARALNLSASVVTVMVNELRNMDFIREVPIRKVGAGRNPLKISVNPGFLRVCGVDMSSYEISICIYDFTMQLLKKKKVLIEEKDPGKLLGKVAESITMEIERYEIAAVGLAFPGILENGENLVSSAIEELEGVNVLEPLRFRINVPTFTINDANAAVLAEFHARKKEQNILGLFIARGIGAGIMANGQLFLGAHGYAGEFENIPITEEMIFGNHELSPSLLDEFAEAINRAVHLLDPEKVVILSRRQVPEWFIGELKAIFEEKLTYPFNKSINLEPSVLKENPVARGAAIFAVEEHLKGVLKR